ncbi:unnamed protein product [Rotaria sp. Silwood2]|nr:unnamed protein product [Rotaria sp. Silwood2]CAF3027997.1 unnamed protein product [Rotaria sp. Silwood2]CAF3254711.1 unnamed protein product [Rotaria sp. Silwood2]CAF3360476.1 unnamed protein product [Rotaria sp. Silwood2]CAF4333672.1 unnamed protein product [Rotaria sp. Silwood2]
MKLSFCQLFLFLFIIINFFQCRNCSDEKHHKKKIYQKLYEATNRTLSSLLSPVCSQVLFNDNNIQSQYISPQGLSGRIIPAGTFPSTILALEYLYGILCPIRNLPPRANVIQAFDLVRIAYDEKYLITQFEFIAYLSSNKRLTFFASTAFDKNYKLCGYDGQIRNLGLTLDPSTDAERQAIINIICTVQQIYCNGTLKQYSSVNDCEQYLMTQIPYGSFDRGDQGNVICRAIHTNFVPLLPSVHCPHVGPTGGGACTDKTIDFYYNQINFLGCAHKQ